MEDQVQVAVVAGAQQAADAGGAGDHHQAGSRHPDE
jgi:hypothetical protein